MVWTSPATAKFVNIAASVKALPKTRIADSVIFIFCWFPAL